MKPLRLLITVSLTICLTMLGKAQIVVHLPGYTAVPFATVPLGDSLTVDDSGRLYAPSYYEITRFESNGTPSLWSSAVGFSLVLSRDGSGFLATRALDHSVLRLSADGSYTTLVPSSSGFEWTWLALSSSGRLVANVWAGPGEGLYSINTTSGAYAPIVRGGPGPAGAGFYEGMVFGPDGLLYSVGHDGDVFGLFRLDSSAFTLVAVLPHGGIGLTVDPSGVFYTATTFGEDFNEVWRVDIASHTTDLLASGLGSPAGISFDAVSGRLFVRDQVPPYQITAIVANSDSDGDGVPDTRDLCPYTPKGAIVDSAGCGIDQLVPCEGPRSGGTWSNHGRYVSAVAKAAEQFVASGLVTEEQASVIISLAASSSCGKK